MDDIISDLNSTRKMEQESQKSEVKPEVKKSQQPVTQKKEVKSSGYGRITPKGKMTNLSQARMAKKESDVVSEVSHPTVSTMP